MKKEVREGYKMTELGEIPEEWEVKKLKDIANICYGKSQKEIETDDGKYKILGTGGVIGYTNDFLWNQPSVLIGRKGTIDKPQYIEEPFWTVDTLFYTKISKNYIAKWFYYYLDNINLKKYNEATGVPSLSVANLNTINIITPTYKEQEKIVSILSSVDEQIDNVDALIEKNKELKKGLMQTLLTKGIGHTKFKKTEIGEIPEAWEVKNLSEVVWYQEGPGLRKWQFTSAGIKVINVTNLVGNYLDLSNTSRYIDESEIEKKYKHFLIDENDIVVASSGNSWGKVSVVRKIDLPLLMNTSVIRFKPMEEERLSSKYLLQFLKSDAFKKQIALLITGSAQPNFGPYHLDRTKIATPNINEQLRIASILSEVDKKIEEYENKKERLEELKKGLMQQLLTGKIRTI